MLIKPTNVAAVICQELSPAFSHVAYGTTALRLQGGYLGRAIRVSRGLPQGPYGPTPAAPVSFTERLHISHVLVSGSFPVCYAAGNASGQRPAHVSSV